VNKRRQISSVFNSVPVSERWYFPLIGKIEEFENSTHELEYMESSVSEEAPDWVTQCLIKSIEPYKEQAGLVARARLNTRMIGAHIGAKSSVCDAMALAYKVLGALRERDRVSWIKWFGGQEEFDEAMAVYKSFAEVRKPQFSEIRIEANRLVMQQGELEQIHFFQGLSKGLTFMMEIRKLFKLARTKREKDAQTRMGVYAFGLLNWEYIEQRRGSLTWQQLTKDFEEFADHKSEITEETLKKIFQRCGVQNLRGAGRPKVPKKIGTHNR
jgi:hypothetical protein